MTEDVIRKRVQDYAKAISAKDLDRVMRFFAPNLVSYDLEPPLRYTGAASKRRRWQEGFEAYQTIVYDVRDLAIATEGDLALVNALNHFKGSLPGGHVTDAWVRWTACFRRIGGDWLIVHDHVSVPADLKHGRAMLDLIP